MAESYVRVFDNNDESFLGWLKENSAGYVVNTPRNMPTEYMRLHRATCHSISSYTKMAKPGGFTERQYIKACSNDVDGLRTWVKAHGRRDGSFSSECPLCKPL